MRSSEASSTQDSGGSVGRNALFPIQFPTLWERYKVSQKSFWTVEEVDLSRDLVHWLYVLTDSERHLLSTVLAFFASSDGIMGKDVLQDFYSEVYAPEVRCFHSFQVMMENVHMENHARILRELILDDEELRRLSMGLETIRTIGAKASWSLKWFDRSNYAFPTRLIAFAVVQGVFFSSSFASIFWFRSRGVLPGLCHSNDLVMRDEGQNVEFACDLYAIIHDEVPSETVYEMIREAVRLEQLFFSSALPYGLRGLDSTLMNQYVEYVADFVLILLGYPVLYGAVNPFLFMEGISSPAYSILFDDDVLEDFEEPSGRVSATSVGR